MADTNLQRPASPISALAWGVLVIRGIVAIIIGLVGILWPEVTLMGLVKLLGVYTLVSGIFTGLVGAIWPPGWGVRRLMVLQSVLGIVMGVVPLIWPETAALVLYAIVAWAIVSGVLEIAAAIRLRRVISGEWALLVGGVLLVIFGVLLAVWPKEDLIALVWIFGVFAVVFGVMQLVVAYRVRRMDVA